jgi:hypothetical protein
MIGAYQQRIYKVWDSYPVEWPASLRVLRLPEQHPIRLQPFRSGDIPRPPRPAYFEFERRRCISSTGEEFDAIVCTGIIVEPKNMRGIELTTIAT